MRICVAGPITKGDQFINVAEALKVGAELLRRGHAPFIPHLTCFWRMYHPTDYEKWMTYDFEWIRACNGLFRMDGESDGADREVQFAKGINLPIFYRIIDIPR